VAGDVTDTAGVATVVAGHDAVVQAAYQPDLPVDEYFASAATALLGGLANAGVSRLVAVGIGTTLEVAPGVPVHDTEGFPSEGKTFSLGHVAQLEVFEAATGDVDWVVLAPPPAILDAEAAATGEYRSGGTSVLPVEEGAPAFSYADLAVALIDEIENPKHHRTLVAVA
jgi:putative NADH-flavin reductase